MTTKEFTRSQICDMVDNANDAINELVCATYTLFSETATPEQRGEFCRLIHNLRRNIEGMRFFYLQRNNK